MKGTTLKRITKAHIETVRTKLKLTTKSKILNISHKDLDGVGCSIIIKNCFRNPVFIDAKYNNIQEILWKIDFENYDAVILTDISPEEVIADFTPEWKDKVLLLDHHDTAMNLHDPENMKFVVPGESATVLVKKFFEKYYDVKFDHLDYFTSVVNDYDMWIHEDPKSGDLNELYLKYWDERFRERFYKGFTDFSFEEKIYIENQHKAFNKTFNDLDIWDLTEESMCMFVSQKWTNEICDKLLKEKGYKVAINRNPKTKNCSVRTNVPSLHIGKVLEELKYGGGHKEAAGFYEPDLVKFQEKIRTLENKLVREYPDVRA